MGRANSETSPKSQNYCSEEVLRFTLGEPGLSNQQIMMNCCPGVFKQQPSLSAFSIIYIEIIRCVGTRTKTDRLTLDRMQSLHCGHLCIVQSQLIYDTLYLHLRNVQAALVSHWCASELQKDKQCILSKNSVIFSLMPSDFHSPEANVHPQQCWVSVHGKNEHLLLSHLQNQSVSAIPSHSNPKYCEKPILSYLALIIHLSSIKDSSYDIYLLSF